MAQHNVIHGSRGVVNWAGSDLLNLTAWSLDVTGGTAEATPMGDGVNSDIFRWTQKSKGHTSWTATTEGYLIGTASDEGLADGKPPMDFTLASDISSPLTATLKLYLTETAGDGWFEGTALVTGFGAAADSGSNETWSTSWQGTGKLTFETS